MPATHENAGIAASSFLLVKRNAEIRSFNQALDFLSTESASGVFSGGRKLFKVGEEVQVGVHSENLRLRVREIGEPKVVGIYGKSYGVPTEIEVVLYKTPIIVYRDDETFVTTSGGYLTPTTCTRLCQFSPPAYSLFGCSDRTLVCGRYYADNYANRFLVAEKGVVGVETPAPVLKRPRAKKPHGTIRWMTDDEGHVYSFNDSHPDEMIFPLLEFDRIGQNGDYTAPLEYTLTREKYTLNCLRGLRGLRKTEVPLDLANAHREIWGMPPIIQK